MTQSTTHTSGRSSSVGEPKSLVTDDVRITIKFCGTNSPESSSRTLFESSSILNMNGTDFATKCERLFLNIKNKVLREFPWHVIKEGHVKGMAWMEV